MDRRLELISEMTPAIWIHLITVVAALIIGAFVLWRRKGDARHRLFGRIWMVLMFAGAVSSFWIVEVNNGGFSPIHILSLWTLFSLAMGFYAIRNRALLPNAIRTHQRFLQSLYATGILIAGGFTLLPHRLLGRLTFGESHPWINYVTVAAMVCLGVWLLVRTFWHPSDETRRG